MAFYSRFSIISSIVNFLSGAIVALILYNAFYGGSSISSDCPIAIKESLGSEESSPTKSRYTYEAVKKICDANFAGKLALNENPICIQAAQSFSLYEVAKLARPDDLNLRNYFWTIYEEMFGLSKLRDKKFTLVELGIMHGSSLRMWKAYFPHAKILGIDMVDKSDLKFGSPDISVLRASQTDEAKLKEVCEKYKDIHVIIDDASHHAVLTEQTFKLIFPCLVEGGWYVIEDLIGFYSPGNYGGTCDNDAAMKYFKQLVNNVNSPVMRWTRKDYSSDFIDDNLFELHFYPDVIFARKKSKVDVRTDEASNFKDVC